MLNSLAISLGHVFKNPKLLVQALTHCSASVDHNERLEFLGDAILGLIISETLYQYHGAQTEGGLSQMRACLVNRETLAQLALKKNIQDYLQVGPGEKKINNNFGASLLCNAVEAIVGAIYLDAGLAVCRDCVLNWYQSIGQDIRSMQPIKHSKSLLQEWLQARQYALPHYQVYTSGPVEKRTFRVVCTVAGLPYSTEGKGPTRREAEQAAAMYYLEKLL